MMYGMLVLAFLGMTIAGAGVASIYFRDDRNVPLIPFVGLSFVLGFGLLGVTSIVLMICNVELGPALPGGLAILGALVTIVFRPSLRSRTSPDRWTIVGHGATAVAVCLILYGAIATDYAGSDGEAFWTLKAKSIQRYGTFRNPDFMEKARAHMHPRYPLLVPSVLAWIYEATETRAGRPMKLTMAVFFVATLPLVWLILRRRLSNRLSAWMTAIYALTPAFMMGKGGGAFSAYCDYPLAAFFLLALSEGERWLEGASARHALLASFSLMCASQIKNEGGAILLVCIVLFFLMGGLKRGRRGLMEALAISLPPIGMLALWSLTKQSLLGDGSVGAFSPSTSPEWFRGVAALEIFGSRMLRAKEWGLFWPFASLIFVFLRPKPSESSSILAWGAVGVLLGYVVYFITFEGNASAKTLMSHNTSRLLLHLMPTVFVWCCWRLPVFRTLRAARFGMANS